MKQFNINVINNFQNNSEELIKAKFKTEEALVNQLCENLEKGFITKAEFEKSLDIVKAVSTNKEKTAKVIEEAAAFSKMPIEKSEDSDEDEDLEKGGEGSRGGKIIGHTKSGKPIYEKAGSLHAYNFNKQEHQDAAQIHRAEASKLFERAGKTSGYHTKAELNKQAKHHSDESTAHDQYMIKKGEEESSEDIEKGGEGSKGGKVIGHTKSGKPIYEGGDHHAIMKISGNLEAHNHLHTAKSLRQQKEKLKADLAAGKYGQGATANSKLRELEKKAKLHEDIAHIKSN